MPMNRSWMAGVRMAGRLTGGIWRWAATAALALPACGGGDDSAGDTGETDVPGLQDECADPVFVDLTVTGQVLDGGVPAAAGVTVRIEERNFQPGSVHGEG